MTTSGTAHTLHVLVARLDRSADRILRADLGVSYSRYLSLLVIGQQESATQRQLAEALGVTEPAISRTVAGLAQDGLVVVGRSPGTGNRRQISLTPEGRQLLAAGSARLQGAFESLAEAAGVDAEALNRTVTALVETLTEP